MSDGMTDTRSQQVNCLTQSQASRLQDDCKARFRARLMDMACMNDLSVGEVKQIVSDLSMDVWHVASNLER